MNIIAILTFCFIWSSAFVMGKIGLRYTDPYTLLVLRFMLASVILLPLVWYKIQTPNWKKIARESAMVGFFNNGLYLGLSFTALQYMSPGIMIIIVSCAPFITTLLAIALGIEMCITRKIIGILIGFMGVLIIVTTKPLGEISGIGLLFAGLATFAFSIGTVLHRKTTAQYNLFVVNFWQSLVTVFILLPISMCYFKPFDIINPMLMASVAYLAIIVTIIAMGLWLWLIHKNGASTAASYHLLNPFLGVIISAIAFGEQLRILDFVGITIIVMGLWITLKVKSQQRLNRH